MEEKKKVNIGLDIGVTSVGWAIVNDDSFEIIDAGSRIFEEADKKNNQSRREKRSTRRMHRRDKLRRQDLLDLFVNHGFLKQREDFFDLELAQKNVYELREFALNNQVTKEELMTILYSVMKRRGTFNWLDDQIEEALKDGKDLDKLPDEKATVEGDKFACQIQLENLDKDGKIIGTKNKNVTHEMYQKELRAIFTKQKEFDWLDESFATDFFEIFDRKLDYFQGPKNPSPFGWERKEEKFYENLIGFDSYDRTKTRAPKDGIYASLFNLLNDLNGLSINNVDRESPKLTKDEKIKIIASIYNESENKPTNLTLERLRKILNVKKEDITGFRIDTKGKPIFTEFKGLIEIYKSLDKQDLPLNWLKYSNNRILDEMTSIFTKFQSSDRREEELKKLIIEENQILKIQDVERASKVLSTIKFSGSHSLSNSTINKVLGQMLEEPKQSITLFHELGIKPQYHFQFTEDSKYVPVSAQQINEMFISPVVKRAFIQSLKVLKEIQRRYKDYEIQNIVIELAREKNSEDFKTHIKNLQKENEKTNKAIAEAFAGKELKGKASKKVRLFIEQHQMCAYCGEQLNVFKVVDDPSFTEIDHIIPESVSFTSSMDNLVLVHANENHQKGQKTPYAYFVSNTTELNWPQFQTFVKTKLYEGENSRYFKKKISALLDQEDYSKEENRSGFISRNLNDTRYATSEIKSYLENYAKETNQPFKIKAINGRFTDYIKKEYFNLGPKDREDLRHHAIDAITIAYSQKVQNSGQLTPDGLQSKKDSFKENRGKILDFDYRFSRMNTKNLNKQLTNETLYVYRKLDPDDEKSWTKIEKCNLFEDDGKIDQIFGTKEVKTLMEDADPETFAYLQKIYDDYANTTYKDDNDKEIRVKNPFVHAMVHENMPIVKRQNKKDPNKNPPVKFLKYYSNNLGKYLDVTHKYEKADAKKVKVVYESFKPFRIDIFKNKLTNKFKILFVNASMVQKANDKELVIKEKEYSEYKQWLGIGDSFDPCLKFYPGDTILYKYNDDVWKICKAIGGDDKKNKLEISYLHRNKHIKLDDKCPDKKIDPKQIYALINQTIDIKLLNLDVLGVKSSKYALE